METFLEVDGSQGEGGGQILRTALALSLITLRPVRLTRIRAGRARPGLMRQHLTCVQAAKQVGCARVEGDELGSQSLMFQPSVVVAGKYRFAIGTAGSTSLVLQTVLPPLMLAASPSRLTLEGGTHNTKAPPSDFLQKTFLPQLAKMGPAVTLTLERMGFFPAGGGQVEALISPSPGLKPLVLEQRGALTSKLARAICSNLPEDIGERELNILKRRLQLGQSELRLEQPRNALGPGNVLLLELVSEQVTEVVSAVGEKGLRAEELAKSLADEAQHYLTADVPVGEHLADQLLIPIALAGSGSFMTVEPSLHTRTNIEVIQRFLEVTFRVEQVSERGWRVSLR